MSFSEFQYSNKRVISAGEIWTAERNVLSLNIRDVLGRGRQLTIEVSNPLNASGTKYFEYQRIRLLDRPTNAIIFLGRIVSTSGDHRKQRLTVTCTDYFSELASKNISTANLYGNRRSDIIQDVISGGTEVGRTTGNSLELNRIVDTSKEFTNHYINRTVKIPGIGPGIITSVAGTNNVNITDSTAPFDNSFINRLIRRVSFGGGRKIIEWEGRVTAATSTTLTLPSNGFGIDATDSGGSNYSSAAHGFAANSYWDIAGFEGKITTIVASTEIDVATVGSTSSPSYKGYKDANFYNWASGGSLQAKGGVQYFIENAEEGVHQATTGNGHTSDKSIDLSRIDTSPYMELVRRSYSKGQGSSEGVRESIQRLARDEVWNVPQVLFFGGHLDSSLGVATNEWMLMTSEANTSVDVIYKPTTAPLPLQKRVLYESGSDGEFHARAVTNPAGGSPTTVNITNQAGTTTSLSSIQTATGMFYDATDPTKNRIQIGNEERRVNVVSGTSVAVDKPFAHAYTASDDVVVGIGPHVGSPRWDRTVSNQGQPASTGNPEMVANGTFSMGNDADGWDIANSSCTLDSSGGYLLLTTNVTNTNLESYCSQTITGLTIGKQYVVSVEVARYAGGNDAAKRRIKVGYAAASYSSGWQDNGYDYYVDVDNATSNNNTYSSNNRLAWTQYSYVFRAIQTTAYINLGVSDANGDRARFDSVSLREAAYDSRLYIGSPKIFNGIKFEMESSTDVYHSMDVEFWGRKTNDNDGDFGWYRIEDYAFEDIQGSRMGQSFWDPPGDRSIDNFNRSGTIKWWDLTYGSNNHLSQSSPNKDWNHWAKGSLAESEPLYGLSINTFSRDKHNHSLEGGIKVTDLSDPELANLYWVRLSVPNNELGSALDSLVNPGVIKNIKILDGRESAFNLENLPNPPGNLGNMYDTTKRTLPQAQWDFRMEDPGFFTAIGKVTVDNSPDVDTWTDYTTNMTTRTATSNMDGFSSTFRGAGKYYYFGADYQFSGIEFNLSVAGSEILPLFEYWNGNIWAGIQDLHGYNFSVSGSARWDMDAIDSLESQGTAHPSYFSQTKWVKRDLRATSATWGNYNYNTSSGTENPHKPPSTATSTMGEPLDGDAGGTDYPGGADALNALNAPHHHLYWIRMSYPTAGSLATTAKITTIRMFSRAAFKYFERGTEPWNFNVTGTEDIDSIDYGKHEFSDAAGQFLISPASGNVWVKNTSAADLSQSSSTYLSASKLGLQPALSRGGVGSDTTYKVSSVAYSGIDNVDISRLPIEGPSPTNKANELKVDQYLLVGSEKMRILSIGKPDVNGVILLEIERAVLSTSSSAHAWGVPVYLLKRTSELSTRVYLSAGLFLHGFAPTNYQGRAGSNYLLYQDKRPGLKNYETYGGDTSDTVNWHGLNIKYRDFRRPQGTNLYRYSIQDMSTETVTRVTVNGEGTLSATATDTALEALYGIRQDKVVFDTDISSVGEAESAAESILASQKPLNEHAGMRATLETYDYPVYSYNSATTSTTDRAIPHVVRAGDVITLTINDGNYRFFDEPFLVQSIVYDDQKSLAKITCTQGLFPTTGDTSTPQAQAYAAIVESRHIAAAGTKNTTHVPLDATGDDPDTVDLNANSEGGATAVNFNRYFGEDAAGENPGNLSTNKLSKKEFEFGPGGVFSATGEIPDVSLTAVVDSGLNKVVVDLNTTFVAVEKGFTYPDRTYWLSRIVIDAAGDTFKINSVESANIIHTTGNKTWAANDTFTVRRLSAATRRFNVNSGSLNPAYSYSVYHDINSNTNKILNTSQVPNPNEVANPLWATILSGFHGVRYTDNSGLLVISLTSDHDYSGGFFHKPLVMATVDPTTVTGDANGLAYNRRAYAVVKRFTDSGGTVSAAQWGTAGSNSGIVSNTHRLHAQGNNNSVSTFNSSHVGQPVHRLNVLNGKEEEGVVTALVTSSQLTTSGITGWKSGDKYIVYGDIQKVEIQVYVPRMSLAVATSSATDSLLVSTSGTPFTSNNQTTVLETAESYSGSSGIAVAYTIIPRAKTALPEE